MDNTTSSTKLYIAALKTHVPLVKAKSITHIFLSSRTILSFIIVPFSDRSNLLDREYIQCKECFKKAKTAINLTDGANQNPM